MESFELEKKWKKISGRTDEKKSNVILLSSNCFCKINLHVNDNNQRCMFLELPVVSNFKVEEIRRAKISISFIKTNNFVMITSFEEIYNDIFDDLIISLFNKIKEIQEPELYLKTYVSTFKKWAKFFDNTSVKRLKENQIQGIFGELVVLRRLLLEPKKSDINCILMSWQGPKRSLHDFILPDKNIEVKTRLKSTSKVRIANEFQLDMSENKKLELTVLCIEKDSENGNSLKELVVAIKEVIANEFGELSILLNALQMFGLNLSNLMEYDEYRYSPISLISYECLNEDFPKLVPSNFKSEMINQVRYSLELKNLEKFVITEHDLRNDNF